jgi:hypothetical protein
MSEEEAARELAWSLIELQERAGSQRQSLHAFLAGPFEQHMTLEETSLFPALAAKGRSAEVQTALAHHEKLRELAKGLEVEADDASRRVLQAAELLLKHVNFEMDSLHEELSAEEWITMMVA